MGAIHETLQYPSVEPSVGQQEETDAEEGKVILATSAFVIVRLFLSSLCDTIPLRAGVQHL